MFNKKMYRRLVCYYMLRSEEGSSLEEVQRRAELFKGSVLTKGEREAVSKMWETLKRWKELREVNISKGGGAFLHQHEAGGILRRLL